MLAATTIPSTPQAAAGGAGPADAIWLPGGQPGPRLRLAQAGGTTPAQPPATGQQADDSAAVGTGLPWHPPSPAPPPLPGGPGTPPRRQR